MRIMIAYPGHSHSTIDVADGYAAALVELGHTVKTYDYHTRLVFYDTALAAWDAANDSFERTNEMGLVLASEPLAIEAIDFVPDVVLIVCGLALHKRAYDLLYRLGLPVVLLLTESPYLDDIQRKMAIGAKVDAVLVNDRASVATFQDSTALDVAYLPHSFNPERHKPTAAAGYESDVFFFGTLWPKRRELIDYLEDAAAGRVFNLRGIKPVDENVTSMIDNSEMVKFYSSTKIALNHHRQAIGTDDAGNETYIKDGAAWSLGPRAYEIAAAGAFQVCDDTRPELTAVFGDSVPTYGSASELLGLVEYYLPRPKLRQEMAAASRAAVANCTFENRADEYLIPLLTEVLS